MNKLCKITIYHFYGINYVGSTKQKLKRRQNKHYSNCFNVNCRLYNLPIYKHIRTNNLCIKLIPIKVLFLTKKSGRMVEQYYIKKYNSIDEGYNNINAVLDKEQYKQNQKISTRKTRLKYNNKYKKKYYKKNKHKINVKINCQKCGSLVSKRHIKQHHRTKKCQKLANKIK